MALNRLCYLHVQITLKIMINDSLFTFNSSSKNARSSMCVISAETSKVTPDFFCLLGKIQSLPYGMAGIGKNPYVGTFRA